jgi:hypothetical protein
VTWRVTEKHEGGRVVVFPRTGGIPAYCLAVVDGPSRDHDRVIAAFWSAGDARRFALAHGMRRYRVIPLEFAHALTRNGEPREDDDG